MPANRLAAPLLAALLSAAAPAAAGDSRVSAEDPYLRLSRPGAPAGAAFMTLVNHGTEADRLIAVASDAAERVGIHTHLIDANGIARMVAVEDGIVLAPGATHRLERGGDHLMFMGFRAPVADGDTVAVTLVFETAGEIAVSIPVDNDRKPGHTTH